MVKFVLPLWDEVGNFRAVLRSRPIGLTVGEKVALYDFFRGPFRKPVQYFVSGEASSSFTLDHRIYFQNSAFAKRGTSFWFGLLIHEHMHVWQHENWRVPFWYVVAAIGAYACSWVRTRSRESAYHYLLDPTKPFRAYGIEQQATLMQDFFLVRYYGDFSGFQFHCLNANKFSPEEISSYLEKLWEQMNNTL